CCADHRALPSFPTRRSSDLGRLLVVQSAMTWQAYNDWGGGSLYDGDDGSFGDRSLAVSFDRPYTTAYGAGRFAYHDLPILRVARSEEHTSELQSQSNLVCRL